jgi:hypothetical protein
MVPKPSAPLPALATVPLTTDGTLPGAPLRLAASNDRAALCPAAGAEDGRVTGSSTAGSKPPSPDVPAEDGLERASSKVTSVLAGVAARRPCGGCPEVLLTRGVTNSEESPLHITR